MTIAMRGLGGLACEDCGYAISPTLDDPMPACPVCSGTSFKRARAFDRPTVDIETVDVASKEPTWLDSARRAATDGPHLAWEDEGEMHVVPITEGWAKVGRSGCADVQLDDPTVSRRHALIVRTEDDGLKALDDRSLNGLFVNGEHVEWTALADGDELEIGRFKLYVIA
ncbi:MAG: FHA domain-containing protein [Actinomycetota bacterium]|nr:FHA domain-containing protein [Actinomycetota bacterium]